MTDSKEHILTISLNLFIQKNFKEVTMNEIVEKTGLSKGAFYHYFKSKEQVFAEVIEHFYLDLIIIDYSNFSQDSLVKFYTEFLKMKSMKVALLKSVIDTQVKMNPGNNFLMIVDAMKMLPDFKKRYLEHQKEELKAWTKIVHAAKKTGEINSKMPDEMIARLFIYVDSGKKLCHILTDDNKHKEETKLLWDGLYKELKK